MDSGSTKACYQKALQILARRDHSCAELRFKLKSHDFERPEIEAVIGECERLNYLNDTRFAASYLKLLQRKGFGINSVQHKLYTKGISKAIIEDTVAPYRDDDVQLNLCRHVLAKKIKNLTGQKAYAELRPKLQRFLFNRGFSSHIIRRSIDGMETLCD